MAIASGETLIVRVNGQSPVTAFPTSTFISNSLTRKPCTSSMEQSNALRPRRGTGWPPRLLVTAIRNGKKDTLIHMTSSTTSHQLDPAQTLPPSLPTSLDSAAMTAAALIPHTVHIGVGGFHRAHQAVYLDDLLAMPEQPRWGEIGVGVLPSDDRMRDALRSQDCLYTLVERSAEGQSARVIGSMMQYMYAPEEREAVLETLASPTTRIVTLTITEAEVPDDKHLELKPTSACSATRPAPPKVPGVPHSPARGGARPPPPPQPARLHAAIVRQPLEQRPRHAGRPSGLCRDARSGAA